MTGPSKSWLQVTSLADGLWRVDEGGFVSWFVVANPDRTAAAAIDCGWGLTATRPVVEKAVGLDN